jgi:hypothetical protein
LISRLLDWQILELGRLRDLSLLLLLQILLLVQSLRPALFTAGWTSTRGGTQILLSKECFCSHNFILSFASISCKQILVRFV